MKSPSKYGTRSFKKTFLPAKTIGLTIHKVVAGRGGVPQLLCLTLLLFPLSPGLGAVKEGGNKLAPPILVEDQGLAAGQDPAAEADLSPPDGVKIVVGREAGAGEALRDEHGEGL